MKNIKLSIIIPIKVSFQNRFLLKRLSNLVEFFSKYNSIELVVVDSSPSKRYSKLIYLNSNIEYYYLDMNDIYSASKARNYGSQKANGEYILFFDVDLIVKDNFIDNIFRDIEKLKQKAKEAFEIYPCLYLSELQTKAIENKLIDSQIFKDIKLRYLEGFNDEVLYLAVNTSTILVSKEHFFNIGAYNEVYKGHGYEDFELIHRLYLSYPIIKRGEDYIMDFKTPFPYFYKGFRQYFAYYALPNFFKGNYTVHLWHPRPLTKKYYRHREVNLEYFLKHLEESFDKDMSPKYLDSSYSNYSEFIDNLLIRYELNNKKYCGLRDLNPISKAKKPKSSIKRKIRRRFLNLLDKIK